MNYFQEFVIFDLQKKFFGERLYIYATSVDYDPRAKITHEFFKTVQNKMHWAAHGHITAEVIVDRADGNKDFMGLTSFEGKIPSFYETTIAKNYLTKKELDILNRIVSMYLDYAELQALEGRTMKMFDWIEELNYFLTMNRKDVLQDSGKISHEYAMNHVEKEYHIFKERINNLPSEVEIHYLESINELKQIGDKKVSEDG